MRRLLQPRAVVTAATTLAAVSLMVAVAAGTPACTRAKPAGKDAAPARPERVREPAVAGQFYPADAAALRKTVAGFFDRAAPANYDATGRVLLAPHAGYVFSGQVAAESFAHAAGDFERVFILTANHNGEARYHGVSLDDATVYHIPGADIPVSALVDELLEDELFSVVPAANSMHMIEVELPLLAERKRRAGGGRFEIVPMVLGQLTDSEIARVARVLDERAGEKPLFVFSLDLSHYYSYDVAVRLDRGCLDALLAKDRERVAHCTTDSVDRNSLLLIMLKLARLRGLEPQLVDYKNSGDISGDKRRVVGYGAVVFRPKAGDSEAGASLSAEEQRFLLELARRTLTEYIRDGRLYQPDPESLAASPRLSADGATFVTLEKNRRLRGCIGSLKAARPLWRDVRDNTIAAATRDPRFPPVVAAELGDIAIQLSFLEPPRPVTPNAPGQIAEILRPLEDGVILEFRGQRSTYLPEVWEQLPDPELFLSSLCRKQGSPSDCWQSPDARFSTYGTLHFGPG